MSRITVYQKLFCYNTIAFKKIEKKIYMQKIHIYYIRSCKFILNPKFYHFFFNYEEKSNLKDIIYYCHKFLKKSVEQPWGLVCTDKFIMQANFLGNEREIQKLIWTQITP